eukprot:jgi/Mesen1/8924/ME000548S08430
MGSRWEGARGRVFTWGAGHSGALGDADTCLRPLPRQVASLGAQRVCQVAAGWGHTAFLTSVGHVYTCGDGTFGQLGLGDLAARSLPCQVASLKDVHVDQIACGLRHTLALGTAASRRGQLASSLAPAGAASTSATSALLPQQRAERVPSVQRPVAHVNDISASDDVLRPAGTLTESSSSSASKLEVTRALVEGPSDKRPPRPLSVPASMPAGGLGKQPWPVRLTGVAAGGDHSGALTEEGHVYLWGRGFGGLPDVASPFRASGSSLRCRQVSLGWSHGLALTEEGEVWSWGSNRHGQLGVAGPAPDLLCTSPGPASGANHDHPIRREEEAPPLSAPLEGACREEQEEYEGGGAISGDWEEVGKERQEREEQVEAAEIAERKELLRPVSKGASCRQGTKGASCQQDAGGASCQRDIEGASCQRDSGDGSCRDDGRRPEPLSADGPLRERHVYGCDTTTGPGYQVQSRHCRGGGDTKVLREGAELQPQGRRQVAIPVKRELTWHRVELGGRRARCVAAGAEHSVAALDTGEVAAWGWGEHGQLGLGHTRCALAPQTVALPPPPRRNGARLTEDRRQDVRHGLQDDVVDVVGASGVSSSCSSSPPSSSSFPSASFECIVHGPPRVTTAVFCGSGFSLAVQMPV